MNHTLQKVPGIFSMRGRATRYDWWVTTISAGLLAQIAVVVVLINEAQQSGRNRLVIALAILIGFASLWATFVVTVQRFRDRGESPWMALLVLIPFLGELWITIVCGVLPNPNQPKRRVVVKKVSNGLIHENGRGPVPPDN